MKWGHVTGTKREKHGQPMLTTTAAERIAAWEKKVEAAKAAAATAAHA